MNPEARMKATLNQKMTEMGERERYNQLSHQKSIDLQQIFMNVADTLMSQISASIATVITSGAVPNTPVCDTLGWFTLYRLKELLRTKLTECGWRDQVKAHCKGTKYSPVLTTADSYEGWLLSLGFRAVELWSTLYGGLPYGRVVCMVYTSLVTVCIDIVFQSKCLQNNLGGGCDDKGVNMLNLAKYAIIIIIIFQC